MPKQTPPTHLVRVKLRGEDEYREFPQAISWGISEGLASVASDGRVTVWPLELIQEWEVPALPPSEGGEPAISDEVIGDEDWFQV